MTTEISQVDQREKTATMATELEKVQADVSLQKTNLKTTTDLQATIS